MSSYLPNISLSSLQSIPSRLKQVPRKVTLTVGVGLALVVVFATFFRRKRKKTGQEEKGKRVQEYLKTGRIPVPHSPNGDIPLKSKRSSSPSSFRSLLKNRSLSGSTSSLGAASTATTSTITHGATDTMNMTPPQLCQLGLETLQQAISYWEDAVMKMGYLDDNPYLAIPDPETATLQHHLENLLDMAYRMQDSYERQCERQGDQVAFESAVCAFAEAEHMIKARSMSITSSSEGSFVSATDLADLSDLDAHREMFQHFALYEAGLMELKHGSVTCRTLRPEMTECLSDTEFLAKLHCVRLALDTVFSKPDNKEYFVKMGRKIIGDLLIKTEKNPEDFYTSYDEMMVYVNDKEHWPQVEDELRNRGVKCFTFYDIVLDFILMDAFDDLENPPSSVITVVQNRWLSNGFKETALSTAVWSVLKAKRRMLKYADGFLSRFYCISETVSPLLAWGFLGPDSELKELCFYFKELVLGFIRDMFSFQKSRYTSVEALAEDIVTLATQRSEQAADKLRV
ncbi:hypothetical protein ACJMK2_038936 [Sinanodonta woodiana]|uniref:Uncharacterized protein n=1 Tax=Sinanodonta woodiana TaxID=1069815 RepID=A0ABD3WAG9_SINWO